MPVRPPRPPEVEPLLAGLSSSDPVVRESASARLAVLGKRAVPGLVGLVADSTVPETARIGALRTLFLVDVDAGAKSATSCIDGAVDGLALEGVTLLGETLLEPTRESAANLALEVLSQTALSPTAPTRRRLAAISAMASLPELLRRPLLQKLEADLDPEVAARARGGPAQRSAVEDWLTTERLPDDPQWTSSVIESDARLVPVTGLRRVIDLVRVRERDAPAAGPWRSARARVHVALARRGSSIAVYDLRETLERTSVPLEDGFVAAALIVADATCLEAVAARWTAAKDDAWLRDQLEEIFAAAARRSRITRGAAAMTRIIRRRPEAAPLLAAVPRRYAPTPPPSARPTRQ